MTDTTAPSSPPSSIPDVETSISAVEEGQARVGELLAGLQASAPAPVEAIRDKADSKYESQLALVRRGIATSLFYALRTKHTSTADHSLRVALCCSEWAKRMGLDKDTRDRVEVAALLHDLGKIGIPDRILRKAGKLTADEQLVVDCCPQLGCGILRGCTGDNDLLNTVLYCNAWYDSRRRGDGPNRDTLPLGSRMIAIADAFDAMTTESVYRRAMSRERALQELIDGSRSQFDPNLALDFNRMLEKRPEMLQGMAGDRWLNQLKPESGDTLWNSLIVFGQDPREQVRRETLFYRQLMGHMKEGVVFTDGEGTITEWNGIMHQLTSIAADAMIGQTWSSDCVRLREQDETRDEDACLVRECLASGALIARAMLIEQPGKDPTPVHVTVSPVSGLTRGCHGTVIVVRDLSDQTNFEKKLESLHHQTTRDPLTGIANRAFFDQVLSETVTSTIAGGPSFSLIICDIDHFKRVNDVHGHPAGDEALVSFTSILDSHCRDGDLVARYGGEEFLLLSPKCDNATAAKRAEVIRRAMESTPLPSIGNNAVTASFGVTEFQAGDTPETVLARADRALLKAKDNGRNRVVQLGSGSHGDLSPSAKKGWFSWFGSQENTSESHCEIRTGVPLDLTVEKLRGFIADHNAEIIDVVHNHISMKINVDCSDSGRRRADRQLAIRVRLALSEIKVNDSPVANVTNVKIELRPFRNRDRRNSELAECFTQVVSSLKSYLIGEIQSTDQG
jgi:diguanylate cyclase (GGDEF)-like protein/PAS domain S-box-containing protein